MARAKPAPPPARPDQGGGAQLASAALVTLLALAASADALRIGFFADDFHFLDVARRVPLVHTLSGAFGVYPWYRPLSRELFFELIARFGAHAPLAAHLANLACVVLVAWLLLRFAGRLVGGGMAAVAPALFVTYQYTRFLTAWASGFQDLLAVALVLLAILDHARAKHGRSTLWMALAPLAKETGFLALPLTFLFARVIEGERRPHRWMLAPALVTLGAACLHVLVRMGWRSAGRAAVIHASSADLGAAWLGVLSGFLGRWTGLAPVTLVFAGLAALAAVALLALLGRRETPVAWPAASRAIAFAAISSGIGLAPLTVGAALRVTLAHTYYAFPAVPFLCLLAASLLAAAPRWLRQAAALLIPAVVAWNVLTLGFRPPSPLEDSAWTFRSWDWREAERLT